MANKNQFSISHEFDTRAENVFASWADPEQLKKWFAPKGYSVIFAKTDIKPNGVIHYCLASKSGLEMWHKLFVQDVIPPAKLSFTQVFSNEQGGIEKHPMISDWPLEVLTTVMIDEHDDKSRLDIFWEPVNATEKEITKFSDGFFELSQEWKGVLDKLESYLNT